MIPDFEDNGCLPPGIYRASLEEVIARFGRGSENREAQAASLQWLIPICRRAGIVRLLINGSFVTDKPDPGDVDCVLLQGPDYAANSSAAKELGRGLPYLEMKVATLEEYDFFSHVVFASGRDMVAKGMVEVLI